ncbi:hypothetical protein CCACVL1_08476 [Corchorus capsularis]|uniref:Endonuclease/exonuclease/phosphatase n=1 Tax=Corchorus capsularis TaxID=210143 RepID=A0A1R3J0H8_COCAP|nr:hypothetical protein CCACVL1_08476 [Corchorus capsularis]
MDNLPPLPEIHLTNNLTGVIEILEGIVGITYPNRPCLPMDQMMRNLCLLYIGRVNQCDRQVARHLMVWLGMRGFAPEPEEVMDVLQQTKIVEELMVQGLMHKIPREFPITTDQLPNPHPILYLRHEDPPRAVTFTSSRLKVAFVQGDEIQRLTVEARSSAIPQRGITKHRLQFQVEPDDQPSIEERLAWLTGNSWAQAVDTYAPMRVLSCNARGPANPAFDQTMEALRNEHQPDLFIITEVRVFGDRAHAIRNNLGFDEMFEIKPEGFSGGIWFL